MTSSKKVEKQACPSQKLATDVRRDSLSRLIKVVQDIADNTLSGRNSGADMARLYNILEMTVSRIVANARHQNETSA